MKNNKLIYLTTTALMAALICVFAPFSIAIPISETPITLATFAVYITACVVGAKRAAAAVIVYLFLGAAGLPVFSNGGAGFSKIAGPTGGYMIGYIFIAIIAGVFADIAFEKFYDKKRKFIMLIVGMVIGTAVCYLIGTVWMKVNVAKYNTWFLAFSAGVFPYIPFDIVKITVAALVSIPIRQQTDKLIKSESWQITN